jgi:hypothetical protein
MFWRRRGLGRWWHRCSPTPEEPKEGGADFAERVMMFGRSVTRARTGHSVAAAAGQTG